MKDKYLLTSGEIQGLIQTACVSLQQCGVAPNAFGQDSGWFLNGLYILFSCPLQLSMGSIFNKEVSFCFRYIGNFPHLINKNNYTNELFSTF